MNTTDPRSIARTIRNTLRVHERTHRAAIRLPDAAAAVVADVLDHYAATTTEPVHNDIYTHKAVLWMTAAHHIAKLFTMGEQHAVHTLEAASDALYIRPAWRWAQKPPYEGRYLCFTGPELKRIVRYLRKQANS